MSNTLTVELPFGVDPDEARLLLSMTLFEEGKVSLGYAAQMAGYSRRPYTEWLGKKGLPVFNYTVEEFETELDTIQHLRAEMDAR